MRRATGLASSAGYARRYLLSLQAPVTMLVLLLWLSAAALAVLYLLRVEAPASQARTLLKAGSVAALALIAVVEGGYVALILALLACALGDALLARETPDGLMAGMGAFALGHVLYVVAFANQGGGIAAEPVRILFQLAIVGGAVFVGRWLWPALGDMRWPVTAYMVLITFMTFLALGLPASLWPATFGALLFFLSDALLSGLLFKLAPDDPARRWSARAVWILYWLGQATITAGLLYPHR